MSDPRWTDETLALVMDTLYEADGMGDRDKARDTLAALADAGLLVEPGSDAEMHYRITVPVHSSPVLDTRAAWSYPDTEEEGRQEVAELRSEGDPDDPRLERRTVHFGPWREAS